MSAEDAAAAVRVALDAYHAALRAPDGTGHHGVARWYRAVEGARLVVLAAITAHGDARAEAARREVMALAVRAGLTEPQP